MPELLLELLSEEIPARMQCRALDDLLGLLGAKLAAAEIPAAKLKGYVTPRRLAVIAHDIPPAQPDRTEERRGPRVGAPQSAIDGFTRAAGIASVAECEIRDAGRGEFYFAVLHRPGRPSGEVLPDIIKATVSQLPWPKSMRWPGASLRWVRPLNSVVCLFDGQIVPLALGSIPVGRVTRGHRFLAPDEVPVGSAAEYTEALGRAHVVLDQDRRREMIRADLDRRAAELGAAVKPDPALLDEVTGLAEFPIVCAGTIDADFMTLPPEVLATAMRTHQKYFACQYADGSLAAHFLFVVGNLGDRSTIVSGNERVLRARLADARFFWDLDRKVRLEDRVEALKMRVYHEKLGSVFDKVLRMERIAGFLADFIPGSGAARRAVWLAKADLSTGMVGEFPELQGVMGRYYAQEDGEPDAVANAVAEHYRPVGPSDPCPTAPVSVAVALADKIDALVAFFSIGEKPTGSRDPFALRRAALGIIRIILENRLRLRLLGAFETAASQLPATPLSSNGSAIAAQLLEFVVERLKVHLRDQGFRHDLIAAALARAGEREDDLLRLRYRVEVLQEFVGSETGSNLLTAYRRASNIVAIEQRKDQSQYDGSVDRDLLAQPEERTLFEQLNEAGQQASAELARDVFETAIVQLAALRRPVDEFFDKVTVNTDVPELRENRLRLLSRIRATMNLVADFSQIEG
jgi:glycyl-tRNA synthetase beta chain